MSKKVAVIFGTRPEAIKVAPVIKALQADSSIEPLIIVTGQHREMLDQVLSVFDITPDVDLNLFKPGADLTDITTRALTALTPVLKKHQPDMVIVQGDTTTSFVAALAAFYEQIPVAHMEAGLRTDDRYSPFPEEINRRLATQLASLHLAPTPLSAKNLLSENIDPDLVLVTGNTVIDALLWTINRPLPQLDHATEAVLNTEKDVVLVTAHRRESWDGGMDGIGQALEKLASNYPEVLFVFPIHKNPKVRNTVLPYIERFSNVVITEPQEYQVFAALLNKAKLILTDSGGVQEEAPSLGKPVLVMRETTERPEALKAGVSALVGTDPASIYNLASKLLSDPVTYSSMATAVNPYGDGLAAERTLGSIKAFFNMSEPVAPFVPTLTISSATVATNTSTTHKDLNR